MDKRTAKKFMGKIEDLATSLSKYTSYDSDSTNDLIVLRALKSLHAACDHLEDIDESRQRRGKMLKEDESKPNYWIDGTVSYIEGDYDFGKYTVEINGGLPTIAMTFNYDNEYADEDGVIFMQGQEAEEAIEEMCDLYSQGELTPKEVVERWSSMYA